MIRALGTVLVPLALALAPFGCHFGPLRARVTPMRPPESGWLMVPGVPLVAQRARADCGAAALAMVLRFWQPATNNDTVRSWIGSVDVDKGLAAGRMREIVRGKGLEAFLIEGKFEDLVREVGQQRPIIVGIVHIAGRRAYPHYEVVVGVNQSQRKVLTADPAEGWREQDFAEFEARWRPSRRLALVVFPGGSGTCQRAHQLVPARLLALRSATGRANTSFG